MKASLWVHVASSSGLMRYKLGFCSSPKLSSDAAPAKLVFRHSLLLICSIFLFASITFRDASPLLSPSCFHTWSSGFWLCICLGGPLQQAFAGTSSQAYHILSLVTRNSMNLMSLNHLRPSHLIIISLLSIMFPSNLLTFSKKGP